MSLRKDLRHHDISLTVFGMDEFCEICGGSGILNVEQAEADRPGLLVWTPAATWCHACATGRTWKGLLFV